MNILGKHKQFFNTIIIIFSMLLIVIFIIFFLPNSYIRKIIIRGDFDLHTINNINSINKSLDYLLGKNLFFLKKQKAKDLIISLYKLGNVSIEKHLPNIIIIKIHEPLFVIKNNIDNQLLLLDRYGNFLEVSKEDFLSYQIFLPELKINKNTERDIYFYANMIAEVVNKFSNNYIRNIESIECNSCVNDLQITMINQKKILWGNFSDFYIKYQLFQIFIEDIELNKNFNIYDIRIPTNPIAKIFI